MTSGSAANGTPVPRLDHVMVLLDGAAHRDVSASGFLAKRFGRIKRKEAESSVAGQYSTLGVAGENTLIELFGSDLPSASPLTGGLVFSFEEPGSAERARAALDASGEVKYHHDLVLRTVEGAEEQQPWYHLISVDLGEGSPLLLFLNEVTPEYFRSLGARPAPDGALLRKSYLDAALGAPDGVKRLMKDVTGVTVSVTADRGRRLAGALAVFGFTEAETAPGVRELRGPGLTLRLETGDRLERVTEVEIGLDPDACEPSGPREFRFGETSRMVLESPETARWSFTPSH
ncbi:hypothetical protein J7E96_07775 [Streptomyces sp. ISL-96]|uniref:DUF5829 family protein n=1 Tax=Streptomyces sp. ISL-96 TaxID=2819191 RepID=UPI001BE66BF5|nr:DUF5829 family protein [Streptomyces sp. ISL-96]MBT2488425.1 hypothetical protein [Streptomyces sp. ISL-96]